MDEQEFQQRIRRALLGVHISKPDGMDEAEYWRNVQRSARKLIKTINKRYPQAKHKDVAKI